MEADWDEITRIAVPSSGLHAIPTPASAVVFDDQQELLWVGNDQVCLGDGEIRIQQTHPRNSRDESHLSMARNCNVMSRSKLIWAKVQSNNS